RAFPIAQALDNACAALRTLRSGGATLNAGQADLLARCDDLEFSAGNDPDGVVDALEGILSDEAEAQNTAALTIAAAQFDNLKARIAALRSGTNGASFGGLALQGSNGAVPLSFASNALNPNANASATDGQPAPAEAGIDFDRWGFFATGTIGDGDRNPGGGSTGFDFETRGLTAGVDYRYNDSLIFGAAVGYASNDTDIGNNAGKLESRGLSISGYSTFYKGDSWYADGVLTHGSNQYDITRNVEFTLTAPSGTASTVDQVNTASPDGSQFSAAFTAGRDFQRGAWGFGPFLRWQYTSVDFDGYTETVSNPNAPGLGLTVAVNERKVKSMQGVLGGKATYTMSTAWGILIPHFQFEYLREFKSDPDALLSRLVFDPTGTQIEVTGSDVDQSFMNLGLGVSAIFANGRSAFMYYEKLLGQEGTSKDSLAIGIRIEF
ncbi:MAG: autotransporter outer membrane beta-barrel domain-containing protein, partial [Lysobacterales bacterium]